MMIVTTMFLTVLILGFLYAVVIRRLSSPLLAYVVVAVVSAACLLGGSVHFLYVGLETLVVGVLVTWAHFRWWRPKQGHAGASQA